MIPLPTTEWVVDKGTLTHVAGSTQTAEAISATIFIQRNTHCTPKAALAEIIFLLVPIRVNLADTLKN